MYETELWNKNFEENEVDIKKKHIGWWQEKLRRSKFTVA